MNATKNLGASLVACTVLAAPAAFADSVTYNFTGTVIGAGGIYASIADGTTVTGTYTINVANGVPSQSLLPVSLTSTWYSQEYSGTANSLPANSAYVFSSTANVGIFSYQTSAVPGGYFSETFVEGYNGGASYVALETQETAGNSYTQSQFNLTNSGGNAYSIAGLPVFAGATTGDFVSDSGGVYSQLDYNLTSLTLAPVPLPAAAWLLLSALGALGYFTCRSQRQPLAGITAI